MASPSCALRTNRCATAASISCHGMREASTASGWRTSIIWSMRARKKSSVAGQANMAVKLPENNRHWTTNWEFRVSDKPPTTNVYAGHEDFSGTTNSVGNWATSGVAVFDFGSGTRISSNTIRLTEEGITPNNSVTGVGLDAR